MDLKSVIKTFAEAWAAASLKMEQTGGGGNCPPLPPAVPPHPAFPSSPWDSLHRPFLPPWPPASPLLLPSSPFLPHLGLESLARLGREGWGSISTSQPGAGVSCSNFRNINSCAVGYVRSSVICGECLNCDNRVIPMGGWLLLQSCSGISGLMASDLPPCSTPTIMLSFLMWKGGN